MNDELRRCPNCGAYVMGDDDRCPRCDFEFDTADGEAQEADAAPETAPAAAEDAPLDEEQPGDTGTPAADQDEASPGPTPDEERAVVAGSDEETPPMGIPPVPGTTPDDTPTDIEATDVLSAPEAEAAGDEPGAEPIPDSERAPDAHSTRPGTGSIPAAREGDQSAATGPGTPDDDAIAEMPTSGYEMPETTPEAPPLDEETPASRPASDMHATQPGTQPQPPAYIVPPAPFTPPPVTPPPPAPSYVPPGYGYGYVATAGQPDLNAAIAYLQQRVNAYRYGGYRVQTHGQYEATLDYGKPLGIGGWILALVTGIGVLWYLLILATSGFRREDVYIVLEDDGRVYEDGPGAAHTRQKRARTGQRWAAVGLIVFFLSLITASLLGVIAGLVLTQDRYQAALREAYPAVTLFEETFTASEANPDDVQLVEDGAVVFLVIGVITLVGLWGGATLFVIGTIHASAYRVQVPPLPGWA